MLRPSPNHGTLRLHKDGDDDDDAADDDFIDNGGHIFILYVPTIVVSAPGYSATNIFLSQLCLHLFPSKCLLSNRVIGHLGNACKISLNILSVSVLASSMVRHI